VNELVQPGLYQIGSCILGEATFGKYLPKSAKTSWPFEASRQLFGFTSLKGAQHKHGLDLIRAAVWLHIHGAGAGVRGCSSCTCLPGRCVQVDELAQLGLDQLVVAAWSWQLGRGIAQGTSSREHRGK